MLCKASRGGEEGKRQLKKNAVVQRHSIILQKKKRNLRKVPDTVYIIAIFLPQHGHGPDFAIGVHGVGDMERQ